MTTQLNNVTKMYSGNTVFSHIQSFLRSKGLKSKNTQIAYESDIRLFFSYMRSKKLEDLAPEDLKFINSDILDYQVYLSEEYLSKGKHLKNVSVNRKLDSIQSLYQFLKRNEYPVNVEAMKVDPLSDDSEPYGILHLEEANQLAELALMERENGKIKRLLILVALRTSLRKEALLRLEFNDIKPHPTKVGMYVIEVNEAQRRDKGKKIYKEISEKMYNEILIIKGENPRIFPLDSCNVNEMMGRLAEKLGIPKERKICFHSLKKTGINYVYDITKDIYAASSQGSHSNISTTAKNYMQKQSNLAGVLMDLDIPDDILDDISKGELFDIIKKKPDLLSQIKYEVYLSKQC